MGILQRVPPRSRVASGSRLGREVALLSATAGKFKLLVCYRRESAKLAVLLCPKDNILYPVECDLFRFGDIRHDRAANLSKGRVCAPHSDFSALFLRSHNRPTAIAQPDVPERRPRGMLANRVFGL
jgi:hypothetical protein